MNKQVKVTFEYGLVIRRSASSEKGISSKQLENVFEGNKALDLNENILSYGPHFGQDVMMYYFRRLESIGLVHVEDFFELEYDHPEWLQFYADMKKLSD